MRKNKTLVRLLNTVRFHFYALIFLQTHSQPLLLLRRYGLLRLGLRQMGALMGNIMPQRCAQLLAVVGEELRVVGPARDGDISHAVFVFPLPVALKDKWRRVSKLSGAIAKRE